MYTGYNNNKILSLINNFFYLLGNIKIGNNCKIGAGSVVLSDIPED